MKTTTKTTKSKRVTISPEREYDRALFRSELVSLFWAVIMERKRAPDGFTLKKLAALLSVDKAQVSRWFNELPNWEANTVADIASALDVNLELIAKDRKTGRIFSPAGARPTVTTSTHIELKSFKVRNHAAPSRQWAGATKSDSLKTYEIAA